MPSYNVCGGRSNGPDPDEAYGTVGGLLRHRSGTTNQFMSSPDITQLNHDEYNYNAEAIKSLLQNNNHIAFRPATMAEANPYLQVMGHIGNGSIQTLRPKGKTDRLSLNIQNPAMARMAPKEYVRAPMQNGTEALSNLRERLQDICEGVGTVSLPNMHMLGYLASDRDNCIDRHDDHSNSDYDSRGMFGSYTCRYNFYVGMHSKLVITAVGIRIDEDGKERTKGFGCCSWSLDSDTGFYIFDPTGAGRHGRYYIVDPTGVQWLICFMHSIVKDQQSSPALTARAVICMDIELPTQQAATELVRSVANDAVTPLSIGSVSTVDITRFGVSLGTAALECSRIMQTTIPFEEDGGVLSCRSCQASGKLIDIRLVSIREDTLQIDLGGYNMYTVGSVVKEISSDRLGTVTFINRYGNPTVTYVENDGGRVAYYHDARSLLPANEAEIISVLGERNNSPNFDDISVQQMVCCSLCADADGETQTVVACKTCHREPVLGGLSQCGGPDCGDHHCIGYKDVDDTTQFTCGDTRGVKLTNDNIKKANQNHAVSRCDGCERQRGRLVNDARRGRHIEPAHIREAEYLGHQLEFGPPNADYYDSNDEKKGYQCRVVGCKKIKIWKPNYHDCCTVHSKVYKRRFVDGAETDPIVAARVAEEDQLEFGPPMIDSYYDRNGKKTTDKQCRVVGCKKVQNNRKCCTAHSKVYKRRFVDGAETDPYEA